MPGVWSLSGVYGTCILTRGEKSLGPNRLQTLALVWRMNTKHPSVMQALKLQQNVALALPLKPTKSVPTMSAVLIYLAKTDKMIQIN